MIRRIVDHRLRARLHGERGFTIVETVVALGVIFASLAAMAYTVTSGLSYVGLSRSRIRATGFANEIIEEIRALPYDTIKAGMSSTDLTGDPNIVNCASVYRFGSCSGEKLVVSTFAGSYTADWIVPHSGTANLDGITASWDSYVTNEDVTLNPYTVTVIVSWTGGSLPNNPGNTVQLQSKFWSPPGCLSTAVHPFAAPCQPFFYGLAHVPPGQIRLTGDLHLGSVDFVDAIIDLPGADAPGQQEQLTHMNASATAPGAQIDDSGGSESEGAESATGEADSDPGSAIGDEGGSVLTGGGASIERLNADCCGEIGMRLTVPSGTTGNANASNAASATDTYACPPEGARETDALPCSGARVRQAGAITAEVPFTHVVSALGAANAVRVTAPAAYTTAVSDRDAVTGYDGLIDVSANRSFGTIYLGGFPTAGMTAPAGMSTTSTADTNYCVRISGYTETARVLVGERTATNPSNSVSGTVFYYNGAGFSNKTVTDATLDTLAVTCQTTQTVSGSSVTWRVQVLVGGFDNATAPAPTQTADPGDSQTRIEANATTTPLDVTVFYQLIVGGQTEVDLIIETDLGSILATGAYGAPPTP